MKKVEKTNKEKNDKKVVKSEKVKIKKKIDKMRLATQIIAIMMVTFMLVGVAGSIIYYIF